MKQLVSILLIPFFLFIWTSKTIAMSNHASQLIKSTWIWDASLIITERNDILSFAQKKQVNEIYLHIDYNMKIASYKVFIEQAHNHGIRVYAVGGNPDWSYRSKKEAPLQFIRWVRDYNLLVDRNHTFDGIQFDIEPYILPEWHIKRQKIIEEWTYVSNAIFKEARKAGLPVSIVIPFWFDQIPLNHPVTFSSARTLSEWMIQRFDHIVVMAYRNTAEGPNGIIALSASEIQYANSKCKPIMIAVETLNTPEGSHLTFYEKKLETMDLELSKVSMHFSPYPFFRGFAIHHYESYKSINP